MTTRHGYDLADHLGALIFTPMMLMEETTRSTGVVFSAVWAACAFLLSLPWILRQIEGFRPLKRSAPPSPESLSPTTGVEADG